MDRPVGLLTARRMPRLTAIVQLLCLALSCVQAKKLCGVNRRSQCVPHHLCDIGLDEDGPMVEFRDLATGNQGCASTEKCCPAGKVVQETEHKLWMNPPERADCGQVNKKGLSFTIRSADGLAQENELPWMTALLHRNSTYLGGGSLVALDVVLTAHHIARKFDSHEIVVRAGEWDFNTKTEKYSHVEIGVRMIVLHPLFNRQTGANNLALVFLEKPLEATRHIHPICLPSRNKSFDRKRCIVSGWGKDAIAQNSFMNIMKKVDLPVVSPETCEAQLKRHKGPAFRLHDSLICAGGEKGKDACMGDGGSPLACQLEDDPDRFEQAGIVNWGVGCGKANTPGVYTDVARFRSWIDEQIQRNSIGNEELIIEDDEQPPRRDDNKWGHPTPTNPTTPPKQYHPTRSSEEINPDIYLGIPTTMRYQEDERISMEIVKSR